MNENAASAVLEEVLRRAMDEGLELRSKEPLTDEEHGELMAYFNILDWGKQQAAVMNIKFGDDELEAFDPYLLLSGNTKKAA